MKTTPVWMSYLVVYMRKYQRYIVWFLLFGLMASGVRMSISASDSWYVVPYFLNVRIEGKYGTPIMASISRWSRVTVLSSLKNGWKKIALDNGMMGYVNGRYLSVKEPIVHVAVGETYKVSVENAFLRSETLQSKVAVLKRGDTLEVLDERVYRDRWIRARITSATVPRYNNRTGYISKALVEQVKTIAIAETSVHPEDDNWLENFSINDSIVVPQSTQDASIPPAVIALSWASTVQTGVSQSENISPALGTGVIIDTDLVDEASILPFILNPDISE